jgi:branched-chain amino acid transport system permease protein
MEAFLLQLAAGIATGGIYASVALAIVMIYQATHHVNFAQGEMATLSTFMALTMIQAGLPYWVAFVGTLVVSFIMGALVERLIMRPVQHAPILTHVGVYIGMLLIIGNMTGRAFFSASAWQCCRDARGADPGLFVFHQDIARPCHAGCGL